MQPMDNQLAISGVNCFFFSSFCFFFIIIIRTGCVGGAREALAVNFVPMCGLLTRKMWVMSEGLGRGISFR
jgi:hypothetical protein